MRKIGMLLILVLVLSPSLYGQTNTFPSSGNVGIGTASPYSIGNYTVLDIKGKNDANGGYIQFSTSNNSGVARIFNSNDRLLFDLQKEGMFFQLRGINLKEIHRLMQDGTAYWYGNASSRTQISSNTHGQYMRQYANDGVTQSWLIRGYALNGVQAVFSDGGINVNGTIYTKEVNVKANAAEFPDYVFEEGYPLQDLETLKAYIQKEKHLPGVPTSAEVGKSGINLYEMNIKLLEKIEELTLYTIAQEEQLKIKQEQFSLLEERLSKLERMLDPKNEE